MLSQSSRRAHLLQISILDALIRVSVLVADRRLFNFMRFDLRMLDVSATTVRS